MSRNAQGGSRAYRPEDDISLLTRVLFAAYFLEAGLVLIVAPWSGFWERNFFAGTVPGLASAASSPFFRGAVSGIGAITAIAGLAELGAIFGFPGEAERQPEPNAETR